MRELPQVEAAGGLTIDSKGRILFIFKNRRWDLPKGLIEGGLDAAQTALAEVSEETGLAKERLSLVAELIPTHHVSKYAKTRMLKRTNWFLLHCSDGDEPFRPQVEEGIERCEWFGDADLSIPLQNCPSRIQYLVRFWIKVRKDIAL